MTHTLSFLPAIGCLAMMFGAGAIGRLVRRTPLVRTFWSGRRPRWRNPVRS
jgi:hypothetical protein